MTTFCRFAVFAILVAAADSSLAQDFSQFAAGPSESTEKSAAVYASISDTDGPEYEAETSSESVEAQQVAFESISDSTQMAEDFLSDDIDAIPASAPVRQGVVSADSALSRGAVQEVGALLGGASYGLPTISGATAPTCGCQGGGLFHEASCGAAGASCGLADGFLSDPSCGAYGGCDGDCGVTPCGALCTRNCPNCCGVGTHRSSIYGEFLYLRARNAELAYGVPIDGPAAGAPAANPIQVGNFGILDPDYSAGFRAGVNVAFDTVSSIDVRYTFFESQTESGIKTDPPLVLRSLVAHPSSTSAASDFLAASASLEVDFDMIDLVYRHSLMCRDVFALNYVLGARYAKLEQQFESNFVANGTESVNTDIDFDGAGLRIGLESERYSCRNQLHVFANGYASFLGGRFRGSYFQGQSFDPTVVNTEWEAGRIVPILDLEMGVGWTSQSGKLRLVGGYMVSAWFNTLTTQEFIRSVQGNDLVDLGQTMTFDGLNARCEYRF